jgi:uncharacterized protein
VNAIVVAESPVPGCLPELAPLLGAGARVRLQALLIERTLRWATAAGSGRAVLAVAGGVPAQLARAVPAEVTVVAGAASAALLRDAAAAAGDGPLLLAGAAWPRVGRAHAAAARSDLEAGAGAVFGPALDGGAYLVGIADAVGDLLALPAGPAGLPRALETARAHGYEIGLLRHERALVTPDDAAAFLADPLLDPELRAALGGA